MLLTLNDLALRNVIERLSFNDRSSLRLVNKRIKNLIDSLPIDNLVVFDRTPPVISTYKFTGNQEEWNEADTAYVYDFDKFFEVFHIKLITVKRLVIRSIGKLINAPGIKFKKLTHLELYDCFFKTCHIIESLVLENYYQHDCKFKTCQPTFKVKKMKNIAYISNDSEPTVEGVLEIDILSIGGECALKSESIPSKIKIKHLKIRSDPITAMIFCDRFPSIEILDMYWVFPKDFDDYDPSYYFICRKFHGRVRSGLIYNVWGCDMKSASRPTVKENFRIFDKVSNASGKIHLKLDEHSLKDLTETPRLELSRLCELLEAITLDRRIQSIKPREEPFAENMKNICDIYLLNLDQAPSLNVEEFLKEFPLCNRIEITMQPRTMIGNELFDHIPICNQQVSHFKMQSFGSLNLKFLLKMTKLKYLICVLYYPIENKFILELLKTLKYLAVLKIHFLEPADGYSKENLVELKKTVNAFIKTDLNIKKGEFSIKIKTVKLNIPGQTCTVIRYTYVRSELIDTNFHDNDSVDFDKLVNAANSMSQIQKKSINILGDDCILKILHYLNFNEQTSARLVSHRFLRLVDSLKVKKLVIFERFPVSPGKLKFTGEYYSELHCVWVSDMQKFFDNPTIRRRLELITKLVIHGEYSTMLELDVNFDKLVHLELYKTSHLNSKILRSRNLKRLYLGRASFLTWYPCHLEAQYIMKNESEFYKECYRVGAFSELRELNCHLIELKTLVYISNSFPNLKTVNVNIGLNPEDAQKLMNVREFRKLAKKLRNNLNVNFFGIPFIKSNFQIIQRFFSQFGDLIIEPDILNIKITSKWDDLKTFCGQKHKKTFDGFFKLVNKIVVLEQLEDKTFFDRFSDVYATYYNFAPGITHDLPDRLKIHPNITGLKLACFPDNLNHVLNYIPVYLRRLTDIEIENFEYGVNCDFLINLTSLKTVKLLMISKIDDSVLIDMIKNLKMLDAVEVIYKKTDSITETQLIAYQRRIQDCISQHMNRLDVRFKIKTHNFHFGFQVFHFVRYTLHRVSTNCQEPMDVDDNDIMRLMIGINHIDKSQRLREFFGFYLMEKTN